MRDAVDLAVLDLGQAQADEAFGFDPFVLSPDLDLSLSRNRAHAKVLQDVLDQIGELDFRSLADLAPDEKITQRHFRILTVATVLTIARNLKCDLCRTDDFIYVFNGQYWELLGRDSLEAFLSEAAERAGVERFTAQDFEFSAKLLKQFFKDATLPAPERNSDIVLVNLQNCTVEIRSGCVKPRDFDPKDFLTYQLPFAYDPTARCPTWDAFLEKVLPDEARREVLAEYIGYIFTRGLKLEKTLLLFGTGANGKSVFFDVINALLGAENVSNYSLESLGENYFRAMIANKLLNYSSEISNRLQAEKFKQLTSGEPVEARLPYGQPMTLKNYAKLAFNCNELPRDVEHSPAFFRRFLIVPFDVTIPEAERDPALAQAIVANELSGVFNWVLAGLQRLLEQRGFSYCEAANKMLENFRVESDSVAMFLLEERYVPDAEATVPLKILYSEYKSFCLDNNYRPLGRNNFSKRLELNGIFSARHGIGTVVRVGRK